MAKDDKDFYFRFFFREFIADSKVVSLSNAQKGILVTAWCFMRDAGSIPKDEKSLRRMLRVEPDEDVSFLKMFFVQMDGNENRLVSERMLAEMTKREHRSKVNSVNGKNGADKRWRNDSDGHSEPIANAMANRCQIDSECESESMACHSHSNSNSHSESNSLKALVVADALTPPASSKAAHVVETYNRAAAKGKLPQAKLTAKRRRIIDARLKESGWFDDFERACQFVIASDFHLGNNDRGWVANLDYLLKAGKATELAENATQKGSNNGIRTYHESPAKQRINAGRRALAEAAIKRGLLNPNCLDGGADAPLSEPRRERDGGGISSGLRSAGPEILCPES
jgi:hypothetical protein